jgi:PIN domain nuclease of toxin-antitoxin system
MNLLLDTPFLWFISGDPRLAADWRAMISDPANAVALSVASVWEAVIKHQLGKLTLPGPPATYLPQWRARHGIASLPIEEPDVAELSRLPPLHRDPFDRIMAAQAKPAGCG